MNKINNEKSSNKNVQSESMTPVRLRQPTYKKLMVVLEKINQKDLGKKVRADDVIMMSL